MKSVMFAAAALSILLLSGSASYLFVTTAQTEKILPKLVDARAASLQLALDTQITTHATIVEDLLAKRSDTALGIIQGAVTRADGHISDVVSIADRTSTQANLQLTGLRSDLNGNLNSLNQTMSSGLLPFDQLASRYMQIPDQLATVMAPSWAAVEPEITCRHTDGTGYGGCWHSRVTGLMGEAVNIGGVFTQRFPELSTSVTGIATDAHTFTTRAVAPRGFWGNFKDVLTLSSGVARAGAAAGLF